MLDKVYEWRFNQDKHRFKADFQNVDILEQNYSQAFQDLFVVSALAGKLQGTYLEVGANHPTFHNNTYLLHSVFGWSGISIEYDPSCYPEWPKLRPDANFILADALGINYSEVFPLWFGKETNRVDYLQLDIDPSINTLAVLNKLPLEAYRFSAITFETDAYTLDWRARDQSREILSRLGYELVGQDVSVIYTEISVDPIAFEDWWVDPLAVDMRTITTLKAAQHTPLFPHHILFKE